MAKERKITDKKVLKWVRKEVENIKKYATSKQINRLIFEELDATHYKSCIYGQMTKNCYNSKAVDLIKKCCLKYTESIDLYNIRDTFKVKPTINVETIGGFFIKRHYSMLENYILCEHAKNESIIQYLKGESEAFEL